MSAVPKKKLCWNCEGNVAKDIENCPYCGVYVSSFEENAIWNPTYQPSSNKLEEIPSPLYHIQPDTALENELSLKKDVELKEENQESSYPSSLIWFQLKKDIFPILFLMMGSIFFLFGIVLTLFSQNGTFTLQWQEKHGLYFLLFAFPLIGFGWKFLQEFTED